MKTLRSHYALKRLTALATVLVQLNACMSWKTTDVSPEQYIQTKHPGEVRLTLHTGTRLLINNPQVTADSLRGVSGAGLEGKQVAYPLEEIGLFEVQRLDGLKTGLLVGGMITMVAGTAISLTHEPNLLH